MGPWTHGILTETAGELTFPQGKSPPNEVQDAWKWFDATLKVSDAAVQTALEEYPVVTYYAMGAVGEPGAPGNEWRTAPAWPPIETRPQPLYLNLDGSASFRPSGKVGIREYVSDPNNPVPTIGGYELTLPAGPKDQGSIESREDLLVFSTSPLESPLEVTGHIHAELWIQSDAPDTDVIVRLCDVYPDGRSFNICEGTLRMRLREGLDRELSMPKDKPVRVQIRLWPTSQIFNQGHQLRVHIASTSFPALEPNLQNGNPPRTGEPKVATNRIYLGGNILASHLILPVADNSIPSNAATELGK
jgi:putative CocE/NonD family hydrolase